MNIILIISLSVAFFSKVSGVVIIDEMVGYLIMFFWIITAGVVWLLQRTRRGREDNILLVEIFKLNNIVRILIYIYTLCLIYSGLSEERFLSTNLKTFINGISAICIFYIFKKKTFKYCLYALGLSYVYSILVGVYRFFGGMTSSLTSIFELHDMAFATGFVIIYFMAIKEKWQVKNLKFELLCFLIIILAFKRIGIFALIISLLCLFVLNRVNLNRRFSFINKLGIAFVIATYAFVLLIISDQFWEIIEMTFPTLNTSGRPYYFKVIEELCNFSPAFLGYGRNAISVIFVEDYSYFGVGNVHSDILRMYAECGFILFGVWLINYLILLPYKANQMCGTKASEFVFVCTLYNFIVYFTDNTELYLVTQFFYILVMIHYLTVNAQIIDGYKRKKKIKFVMRI